MWADKDELRGPVLGILAAINILAEKLVANGLIDAGDTAKTLEATIEELKREPSVVNIDAAVVLSLVHQPLAAAMARRAMRKSVKDDPEGKA
jgi:hypothetical protein